MLQHNFFVFILMANVEQAICHILKNGNEMKLALLKT